MQFKNSLQKFKKIAQIPRLRNKQSVQGDRKDNILIKINKIINIRYIYIFLFNYYLYI